MFRKNDEQTREVAYISTCIETDVGQLTIHAFDKDLMVREIRRTTDNSIWQEYN